MNQISGLAPTDRLLGRPRRSWWPGATIRARKECEQAFGSIIKDADKRRKMKEQIEVAKTVAAEMLKETKAVQGDWATIDPDALAESHEITVIRKRLNKDDVPRFSEKWLSGVMRRQSGQIVIGIEARDPVRSQRFTLAHELAHHTTKPDTETDLRRAYARPLDEWAYWQSNPVEYETDLVAHMYLMPTESLVPLVSARVSVAKLARQFEVTLRTMTRRLFYLNLELSSEPA